MKMRRKILNFRKTKRIHRKRNYRLLIKLYVISIIVINTSIFLNYINKTVLPHIEYIVNIAVNKSIHNDLYYMFDENTLGDVNLTDIIHLTKNEEDEVLTVDYRYDIAYEYLSKSMNLFYEKVGDVNLEMPVFKEDNNTMFIPLGTINKKNVLFQSFGFKIPIKVELLNDISMKFKTKISEYGLNNLLVELYIIVKTNNYFFSPNNYYNFSEENELLIASKIVVGKIPLYYGNSIEKSSSILSS